MEFIIIIAALIGAVWWFTAREKALEKSGRHPLDGNVTRKEPDLTTKPDGIGHETIPVAPILTQQNACGCGRSSTGFCVGLHSLSEQEWAAHADNPNKPATKPRKPRAKKSAK